MLNDAHEAMVDFSATEDALAGIVIQETGVEGGVAKENEALSLLDYHKTRNMFIDDIAEVLRTFSVIIQYSFNCKSLTFSW